MPTIRLEQVGKNYRSHGRKLAAVEDIDLLIPQGDYVFLVGSRGAGKSTLMKLMSGQVKADRGVVYFDDWSLRRLGVREKTFLSYCVGLVPQESSLDNKLTVLENLTTVRSRRDAVRSELVDFPRVRKALGLMGMSGCEGLRPLEMSVTQCRRVEVAKAIVNSPDILLLDEVADTMDEDGVWDLLRLLDEMTRRGTTIVMSTADSKVVNLMRRRVVTLSDGKIAGDVRRGRYGDTRGWLV